MLRLALTRPYQTSALAFGQFSLESKVRAVVSMYAQETQYTPIISHLGCGATCLSCSCLLPFLHLQWVASLVLLADRSRHAARSFLLLAGNFSLLLLLLLGQSTFSFLLSGCQVWLGQHECLRSSPNPY